MDESRKEMLRSIRPSDRIMVDHGNGKMLARVWQTSPCLMIVKLPKSGREMKPQMVSIFDVIEIVKKGEP